MTAADSDRRRRNAAAFSLLEVVVAAGLCAGTVAGVLLLLPPILVAVSSTRMQPAAWHVARAVQAEWSRRPLSEVAAALAADEPWFASVAGDRIGPAGAAVWIDAGPTPTARDGAKFFEIAAVRNEALTPCAAEPAGAIAYTLRLRWPAYTADGRRVTDPAVQDVLLLPGAVTR